MLATSITDEQGAEQAATHQFRLDAWQARRLLVQEMG
jgi:hypothetical protein